ncbi:ribosomal protein S27, putative [Trichomonas vaginalis G3]|uniref:40S ribosomal protein S27 n=1 Tax=Trichomonas vaginalis (strain ATCC PRA-98 / G3) TaxID=412133 RepID=A2FBZ2_TRIV3|nr:Chain b 40s Ribosomal Protein S27 [Trichomonas vaginalis G3]EAX97591.1 ribosomal protein S27, putative [Trichomonas vaginalis G3]KAI5516200.1 Chain b 40s Ribosomal Protein S27 [Trichomonas vaginalis G3]5XYI_b Chain b, 40S ribosomal protein S27 [Trichomonas vaginalis]|eukprot:XP_001310521.1 ribosomal protein S27 [Trichomonas vaginalis G3]
MTTLDVDILHPSVEQELHTNKKKTLVPNPRSEFLSLRCPSCTGLTTAFSHSNVPVFCKNCQTPLATPTGGRILLADQVEIRPRVNA